MDEKRTNPLSGVTVFVIVLIGLFLGFFSQRLGGWGLPAGVAALAVAIPVLKYKRYWRGAWFWITVSVVSLIQIPLVLVTRPLMDRFKFGFNILFATVDAIAVILVVNWVRPKE